MKAGYGKAGKQKTLSNFPTATTTTNYNYLWDTDSEGKVILVRQFRLGVTPELWGILGDPRGKTRLNQGKGSKQKRAKLIE